MRRPTCARTALIAVALSLLGGILVAAPAQADYHVSFGFERAPGMPTSDQAARTVVAASAAVRLGATDDVTATVELGAEPDADTDADLVLSFGTLTDGACVPAWSHAVSTLEPGDGTVRDGAEITIARTREEGDAAAWDCATVLLTESGDAEAVFDAYDGTVKRTVVSDPYGQTTITRVTHRRLPHRTWSFVRVKIRYRGADARGVVLRGHGKGVKVEPVRVRRPLTSGETLVVKFPVRLRVDHRTRMTVSVAPIVSGLDAGDAQRVRVRPAR